MLRRSLLPAAIAVFVLAVVPQTLKAGTPLICFPFDIGNAQSLPWGNNPFDAKRNYDLGHLITDTQALLTPDTPVIVRMETLRRATLYARQNPVVAKALIGKLQARAEAAEAEGPAGALPLFDYGYLIETYKQAGVSWKKVSNGSYEPVFEPSAASTIDGYALVQRALSLRGQDPEMEFAAAVITAWPRQESYAAHLRRAVTGATEGSLLAKNLVSHLGQRGTTIADLRVQVGMAKN